MQTRLVLPVLAVALLACTGAAIAQKAARKGAVAFFPPAIVRAAPGIQAVLSFTGDQQQQLAELRQEVFSAEAVQAAQATARDPAATPEQRKAARQTLFQAEVQLAERAAGILTSEQKALIEKITAAFEEVQRAVRQEYREKLAATRGDKQARRQLEQEMQAKVREAFALRLDALLTPAQKEAMQQAAARQSARTKGGN